MATLYELNEKLRDFELDVDVETGEILNADELEQIELERSEKLENLALWIKNLKSDAEAYKREKEAFIQKEQAAKHKAESLKAYLEAMLCGEKFKSDKVTISYRKSESVEVEEGFSDERFIAYEPKLKKIELKEAIKRGEEIAGARIIEKQNIQIR